jgi:Predicted membrane protein
MVSRASGTETGMRSTQAAWADTISAMNALWNSFETLLGLSAEPRNLTFIQIALRGIIVFLATLAMVRLGHKRSLSHKTPFDAVLLVILASVLSRAINGSAAFFATIGGGLVLVLLHRLFAHLAYYSHGFGILVKGRPDIIVRDGQCDFQMMRRNHISTHDLDEDMRLDGHLDDLSKVRLARVERSGDISFIKK